MSSSYLVEIRLFYASWFAIVIELAGV